MRILLWTELFWPYIGGGEVLSGKFVLALRERGYDCAVVTSHGNLDLPDEADYQGIPVHRFRFWEAIANRKIDVFTQAMQRVAVLKQRCRPDLVHVYFTDPTVFFHLQTQNVCPAPMLVSLHVRLPTVIPERDSMLRRVLHSAQWVTAISQAMLADARKLIPEIAPYSSCIYNGLKAPSVPLAPLPFEPPRLLCLGRLVRDKGFDLAVTAFASVLHRFPKARLVIAGDGPARGDLERQTAELGVVESVDFVGWVEPDRVPQLINRATLVVMPSRWNEAFGLVALEAALMGRPVVAARDGGLPEVVQHARSGLVVEREDSHALAEAMAALLHDPQGTIRMGRAARVRAEELFSLERHVNAYEALYRKLGMERREDRSARS